MLFRAVMRAKPQLAAVGKHTLGSTLQRSTMDQEEAGVIWYAEPGLLDLAIIERDDA